MSTSTTPTIVPTLLEPLADERQVLLMTKKRNGTRVGTPVNLAVEGDHAFFRTWTTSGKARRLRNFSEVDIAPCTMRGRVIGPWIHGRATPVSGEAENHARALIEHKHPFLQRIAVRFGHWFRGLRTEHYVVTNVHT